MKKGLLLLLLVTVIFGFKANAQQDPQFTQYMNNTLFYNPGYAGMDQGARFSLLGRTQWFGNQGTLDKNLAPNSQVFSFNAPLLRANSGIGVVLLNDNIANQNRVQGSVSYAYHVPLGEGKLSIGARAGYAYNTTDWNSFRWNDNNDPLRQLTGNAGTGTPDFGAGLYYKSEKYFLGVSSTHLYPGKFDYGVVGLSNKFTPHLYLNGGYNFDLNSDWVLTPSVLVSSTNLSQAVQYSYAGSIMANYNNKFYGGLQYRYLDAASIIAGLALTKDGSLRASYSFDLTVPSSDVKKPTSHELFISYTLPVELRGAKPIIRTPRYRK